MNLKYQNMFLNLCGALSVLGGIENSIALPLPVNEALPIVAVIDTGVDINHPILRDQIWSNPGETGLDKYGRDRSNNNIDDDMNGFIDDVHGWNFLANNNDLSDHIGHGTHVSGIIVSQSKNLKITREPDSLEKALLQTQIPQQHAPVKLMVLKFFDSGASGEKVLQATAKAIDYASKMGATIINYSAGGRTSSPQEYQALLRAKNAKIIVIAAAGNDHTDNDLFPFFPASYHLSNIMAVGATDNEGKLLPSSNFGKVSVAMRAPGKDIWSSLPGGKMGKMTGTSQATAMITARLISEKFRAASIQRGAEEVERLFEAEISKSRPKSKMTDLNLREPLFVQDRE